MRTVWPPLLLWGLTAAPVLADDSLPGNPTEGQRFAREVCVACHYVEKDDRGVSSVGAPAFQDVADDPAITAISLRVFLRTPHETMPDLILTTAQTDHVIAYVLSLK
jgi:mono/diheme cytochrome c family protein